MKSRVRVLAACALALVTTACEDALVAKNLQSPDIIRVYAQPSSIETALATGYQSCRQRAITTDAFQQMQVASFEGFSELNNENMGPVGAIPRAPFLNTKAATTLGAATFNDFSRFSRNASNAIAALDRLTKAGSTIGTPGADTRARAFGFFDIACNLGWLAAMYDSAAVVNHFMASDSIPPLVGYNDVAVAALAMLDSAIAQASLPGATGQGGFPTPALWMSGKELSKDEFVRLMRSWKARIRTIVPRSKAERDALNWQAIIADAENGITADILTTNSTATGWTYGWPGNVSTTSSRHQITFMIMGAADVTGAWDTWLATPKGTRTPFLLQTPDLRWPAGATRAAQQAASIKPGSYTSRPYIHNRSDDTPGAAWGTSFYGYNRYEYYKLGGLAGSMPEFLKAEIDLIAAEGYIRTGNIAAAAAKVDITRVARGGLPPLSGVVTTATQLIPGGANCVPRMAVGPNFNSTTCADIWEAMKYEKRIELLMYRAGVWFFDSRGWQSLYQGTPLMYPVPVQEIDARYPADAAARYYNIGGGGIYSAPISLFGFEIR